MVQRQVVHSELWDCFSGDRPIHFCAKKANWSMNGMTRLARHVGKALEGHECVKGKDGVEYELLHGRVRSREVTVGSGYFKAHLSAAACKEFIRRCELPVGITIRGPGISQTPVIAFLNTKDGQSNTHLDRDTSILMLVEGGKVVKLSPPIGRLNIGDDGILDGINPFSMDSDEHGGRSWETVIMKPGSLLLIPKGWIHCVRSVQSTLAFSLQVCGRDSGDKTV